MHQSPEATAADAAITGISPGNADVLSASQQLGTICLLSIYHTTTISDNTKICNYHHYDYIVNLAALKHSISDDKIQTRRHTTS